MKPVIKIKLKKKKHLALQFKNKKFLKATLRTLNMKALLRVREVSNAVKFC